VAVLEDVRDGLGCAPACVGPRGRGEPDTCLPIASDGVRLVHGEADGLPGLIVDRYADTLCAQFLSVGVERWKATIADRLLAATGLARLYERSDSNSRALEGLQPATGWLRGSGATEVAANRQAGACAHENIGSAEVEISGDTGVGGAVADAIGARLARLAGKVQVMAVTHAPQVAARANQHLLISKDALDKGKRVATRVNALAADHRREEIARMLAGAEITAEARAAADRLLRAATA